ncbi:MAG: rane-flanked domain protein [Frankiales bacterium]|nr:rane-flanked domain protein [Frankiales bacterium]
MHMDLTTGEEVILETRPHWKALLRPSLVLIVAAGAIGFALAKLPDDKTWATAATWAVIALGALAIVLWTIVPWLRWITTHIILTNERLITRDGVLRRVGRDIPLYRVNDVSFEQSVMDRMLRCGNLIVESGGERGQIVLVDIPRIAHVQHTLHSLLDHDGPEDTAQSR